MRKKLTLMFVALISIAAFALQLRRAPGSVFTLTLNGTEVSSPEGFFTHDGGGKFNFNNKFKDAEFDGISFTKGLKMEGSTKVLFTTDMTSTVTIVQSTWKSGDDMKTIKFDDTALAIEDAEIGTGCYVYTLKNVAAGNHTITRGSGESGIFYVKVQYPDTELWTNYKFTDFNFNKAGIECSSSESTAGDITEETGSLVITDGETNVKMTVTPSTGTANRFWSTKNGPQLRVYGGTITFEAPKGYVIEQLTFNNGKWNKDNAADNGEFNGNVWTGKADKVVVTIAGNTQLNSIDVKAAQKKYYITGDFNNYNFSNMVEMLWNETNKAYEFELSVTDIQKASFFITDIASVENFMALEGHRYSIDAELNTKVGVNEKLTLVKNSGSMKLILKDKDGKGETVKGKYTLSMDADMNLTIKKIYENVEVAAAPGKIEEAIKAAADGKFVRNLTLNLQSGNYTIAESIVAAGDIIVKGVAGTVIDASALTAPFAQLDTAFNKKDVVNEVSFEDVTINGLPTQLFYANKQVVLLKKLLVENSVIGVDGKNKKTIFDFNGGGLPEDLIVNNSTIWANPTIQANGAFYSTQSGSKISDVGATKNYITVTNSTLYNITTSNQMSTLRQNSQNEQKYIIKSNIIVGCGASNKGLFLKGINANQKGKAANFEVDSNSFGYYDEEAKYVDASETENSNIAGDVKNSVPGEPKFAKVSTGDFTLAMSVHKLMKIGDPRWNNTVLGTAYQLSNNDGKHMTITAGGVNVEYLKPVNVKANETVIVDVTPDEGYVTKRVYGMPGISVSNMFKLSDDKYIFAMPAKKTVVRVQFMAVLKDSWIAKIDDQTADGDAIKAGIKPEITVTDEYTGQVIDPSEYEVTFENNTAAGEATVTVKAKDVNYTGTATAKFNIIQVDKETLADGSEFWYEVVDASTNAAIILGMTPADGAESFTVPATVDGFDVVAIDDYALQNSSQLKDIYLPTVKGEAIILGTNGYKALMGNDNRPYIHPTQYPNIHTSVEALGGYAEQLPEFVKVMKISAVKENAPRFWTFSCAVDVKLSDGKAFIVKAKDNESVEKAAIGTNYIAAGNGVLIEGAESATYTITAVPAEVMEGVEVDYAGNALEAVTAPKHFGLGYYILKNGAFHAVADADTKVPAGKAVLHLEGVDAPVLMIVDAGNLTGINVAAAEQIEGVWYDMNGRKFEQKPAQKGLYIFNGKKVVLK